MRLFKFLILLTLSINLSFALPICDPTFEGDNPNCDYVSNYIGNDIVSNFVSLGNGFIIDLTSKEVFKYYEHSVSGYIHNDGGDMPPFFYAKNRNPNKVYEYDFILNSDICNYGKLGKVPCAEYSINVYSKYIICSLGQVFNSSTKKCELNRCEKDGLGFFKNVIDLYGDSTDLYRSIINDGSGNSVGKTCYDAPNGKTYCEPETSCVLNCDYGSIPISSENECASYFGFGNSDGDKTDPKNPDNGKDNNGNTGSDNNTTTGGDGTGNNGSDGDGVGDKTDPKNPDNPNPDNPNPDNPNPDNPNPGDFDDSDILRSLSSIRDKIDNPGIIDELKKLNKNFDDIVNSDEYSNFGNSDFDKSLEDLKKSGDEMKEKGNSFLDDIKVYSSDFKKSIDNLVDGLNDPLSTVSAYKTCYCPYNNNLTYWNGRSVNIVFDFCKFICPINSSTYLVFFLFFSIIFFLFLFRIVIRII